MSWRPASGGRVVAPARPWVILQHVPHEGPGLIGEVLSDAGHEVAVVRVDRGDALPDHRAMGGLVVMGGPMGVHDGDVHPWLAAERSLLSTAVDEGLPVLGVCLGAQQLAVALGGQVTTGPAPEIGFGEVELTAAGRLDPVFGPEYGGLGGTTVPCVHWHHDTFTLPVGATHLAATRACPHQAFRVGDLVYALQFHVEVDRALAGAWAPHLPDGVVLDGPDLARVESVGRRLVRRFVDRAAASNGSVDRAAASDRSVDRAAGLGVGDSTGGGAGDGSR